MTCDDIALWVVLEKRLESTPSRPFVAGARNVKCGHRLAPMGVGSGDPTSAAEPDARL